MQKLELLIRIDFVKYIYIYLLVGLFRTVFKLSVDCVKTIFRKTAVFSNKLMDHIGSGSAMWEGL